MSSFPPLSSSLFLNVFLNIWFRRGSSLVVYSWIYQFFSFFPVLVHSSNHISTAIISTRKPVENRLFIIVILTNCMICDEMASKRSTQFVFGWSIYVSFQKEASWQWRAWTIQRYRVVYPQIKKSWRVYYSSIFGHWIINYYISI